MTVTLTLTLSYDLELERQGTQGSLAAEDRNKTVDDGGAIQTGDTATFVYTEGCVGTLAAKLLVVKQTEMSLTAVQFIRPVSTVVIAVTDVELF